MSSTSPDRRSTAWSLAAGAVGLSLAGGMLLPGIASAEPGWVAPQPEEVSNCEGYVTLGFAADPDPNATYWVSTTAGQAPVDPETPVDPEDPDGTDPDGTDPDGTDPDGTDPDGSDPDGTDPDGTNPDGSDPDGTDPEGTDPDGTDPDGTDPDGTDPEGTNPDGTDPDGTDPDGTDPEGTDSDGAEIPGAEFAALAVAEGSWAELEVGDGDDTDLVATVGPLTGGNWYDFRIQVRAGDELSEPSEALLVQISEDECETTDPENPENPEDPEDPKDPENPGTETPNPNPGTGTPNPGTPTDPGTGTPTVPTPGTDTPEVPAVPQPQVPVTPVPDTGGTPQVPATPVVPATVPTTPFALTTDRGAITSATAGESITIVGTGFAPNSTVTVIVYSEPRVLGTVLTDANGSFRATVTVPADLAPGQHSLVASGVDAAGNERFLRLDVTVSASGAVTITGATGADGEQLAFTGAEPFGIAAAGLGALAAGGFIVFVSRRRTAADAEV